MKKFSVLLMILAIVCALFADKIDMAVKGNKNGGFKYKCYY